MREIVIMMGAAGGTIMAYLLAVKIYKRFYTPLLLPVAVATAIVIVVLALFDISYEEYMTGAKWIDAFLGPAVVALALPLYQNRHILKRLAIPIVFGTFTGAVVGVTTGVLLADAAGFPAEIIYSITPKSVTTPVAMDISASLTGISSLAAVFVMIAGISGAMCSKMMFRLFQVKSNVGIGVGMGSASHAIGTARAFENNTEQGSISTIAMILSAVFVSIIAPLFIHLTF